MATKTQVFGPQALRAALDSSPLWGAGRVEDTFNLIGHARNQTQRLVAKQRGGTVTDVGHEAGAEIICGSSLKAVLIDRAYLNSHLVRERNDGLEISCKAWPVREGKHFSKQAFTLDWDRRTIRCPTEQEMPFQPGGIVHFPKETCAQCPLKAQCTTSAKGRSVSIHPDEALLIELRERQQTPQGRAQLRERVAVEHTLARVGRWQGRRARYRGVRQNLSMYVAALSFTIYIFGSFSTVLNSDPGSCMIFRPVL